MIKRISPEAMAEIDRLARKIKEHNDVVRDSTGRPLTACVKTFGCQMNEHDSEKLRGMLKRMGYDIVPDFLMGDGATVPDVVLFNTCCVRENAEDRIFGQIGAIKGAKRLKPDMIVAVCGCMTEQGWVVDRIKKSYRHVDIVLGTGNTYRLPEVMAAKIFDSRRTIGLESEDSVPEGIEADRDEKFRAYVTIMYGCDNFCSYCIVPYVRGRERSRRPDDIINEIRVLTEGGTKEIMLLGQNVNSYGKGLEAENDWQSVDFASLIRRVCRETDIKRVRFMTSHPKDLSPDLIAAMAEESKICAQLHLPVQSGSTSELKRMNRKYTREQYLSRIADVRKAIPEVTLSTDIMIGFPGETEAEFRDTLALLEEVRFDAAFTFIYSKRQGTPAAASPDQVPEDVVKERFQRLTETQNRISREKNEAMRGTVQTVLTEGVSRTNIDRYTGRTEGNKIVNFTAPASANIKPGDFARVLITEIQTWSLEGELIEKQDR